MSCSPDFGGIVGGECVSLTGPQAAMRTKEGYARSLSFKRGVSAMPYLRADDGVSIFFNDWGQGRPVILIHGWALNSDMWSDQSRLLAENGMRVIAYDRRGFGRSEQPWNGYSYGRLAGDLANLIDTLDLREATLVGFSMGGGEVARYISAHGVSRLSGAILVSAVTPVLAKTNENRNGIEQSVFDQIFENIEIDRPKFLAGFGKQMFDDKVSDEMLQWSLQMGMMGSLRATLECLISFSSEDFRPDMAAFQLPTLIVHGTADTLVPIEASARYAAKLISHAELIEYQDQPHGLHVTSKDRLGTDILSFVRRTAGI